MGKRMSQKEIKNRISELRIEKRNGMMRAVVAFVGMAVLIAFYLSTQSQENGLANTQIGSLLLFVTAIVAAAIAGMGTRAWKKAKDEISRLEKKLK